MKKLLLLFTLALSVQLFADQCGYGSKFEEISCPPIEEGGQTTISNVDYLSGTYTCRYANSTKDKQAYEKKIKCVDDFEELSDVSKINADVRDTKINEYIHKFANTVFNKEGMQSDHFVGSTDFREKFNTHNVYLDLIDFIKEKQRKKTKEITFPRIDSHTHTEKTLGAIISGVFTLDPEFFIDGYINSNGELELNSELKATQLTPTETNLIGLFSSKMFNDSTGIKPFDAGKTEQLDVLSFMDKQVLGYLTYLGISFKQAYMNVVSLVLGMGMFWSVGYYMFKKLMTTTSDKDDFNVNMTSWIMGAGVAIIFFVAPIINDGKIDGNLKSAIYDSKINSQADKETNWSTPAQEFLRYFVQQGNYFGNLVGDYGMHAYLTLVSYKQGMMNNLDDFYLAASSDLRSVANRKMRLGAQVNFYNSVCRDYYKTVEGTMLLSKQTTKKNSLWGSDDDEILKKRYGINADRLDFKACAKMEQEIQNATNSIVAKIDTARINIETTKTLFNQDSDARKDFQRYINTMVYTQNQFGWVDSPIVPISYFFFKNADYFAYNEKIANENKNSNVFKNAVKNYNDNDEEKGAITRAGEWMTDKVASGVGFMITSSFWFVVPGFEGIYKNTKESLMSMYVGNVQIYNALVDKDGETGMGILSKTIGMVSGMVSKITSRIPGYGKLISVASDMIKPDPKKSALVAMLISVFSLLLAIVVIKMVIEGISIAIIAVFLAIKITLFMLEILFFYFVAPAIGIFYAIMNNGQSKNFVGTYFQNLGILAMTPMLITITTYLIIVVSEFLRSFFLGLIHLFIELLNTGSKDLYESSDSAFGSVIQKILKISMIDGISSVFIYFSVMVVATIMIFNFRDWFTKLVGIDSAMNIMKEGGNEMKQGVTKYVNPVG